MYKDSTKISRSRKDSRIK